MILHIIFVFSSNIYIYIHICFIKPNISWWVLGLFPCLGYWLLKIVLQWTLKCMYHFKLKVMPFADTCPEVEVLDHIIVLFLVFFLFWGVLFCFVLSFCLFRATPIAYGGSQARESNQSCGCLSQQHARSKLRLRPISQFTATVDS